MSATEMWSERSTSDENTSLGVGWKRRIPMSTRRGEITPAFHHAAPVSVSVLRPARRIQKPCRYLAFSPRPTMNRIRRVAVRPDCPSTVLRPSLRHEAGQREDCNKIRAGRRDCGVPAEALRGSACSPARLIATRCFQILQKIRTATMTLMITKIEDS